jgi:hypothetical protein
MPAGEYTLAPAQNAILLDFHEQTAPEAWWDAQQQRRSSG